jgi:fatty acid desaturase
VPAAGFLVRLFMIQHDCGHGSFFRRRLANDWVGRVIGVLTLTPYDFWRRTHALHHANSGNLDHRGIGDVATLTAREFLALSRGRRLLYRLYRHPIVMFGIGPAYVFILRHRLPMGLLDRGWRPWLSAMATNVAIAVLVATMIRLVGIGPFLLVHLPIMLPAASIGVWLFYVQHQFEDTFWAIRRAGIPTRRRCTAVRTTTCRASCAGSPPISGCTMCTIYAAESRITGYRKCSRTTRSSLLSGDLPCSRACDACAWPSGTRSSGGSSRFAR